ncbi:MAG TPA: response regulator [Humidesulfovibrio sp.]|uniref:response regulator n=1 Tax=Humidesulfovibrio sp. TaxID=2910988 RepID=UPI002C7DE254|nr:response regulator [Humidesulfovibrio sp.]HWR05009.1 response regulator [Humidesulfovibrio sp.]
MNSDKTTVLVIEDEAPIRCFLRAYLESQSFRLIEAESGEEGLGLAASHQPALILLDLGLPGMDGLEVIRRIRQWTATPILVLSARGKEQDKIDALDAGADDYLTKPFGVGELSARLRVALRHSAQAGQLGPGPASDPVFRCGELAVDLAARRVRLAGQEVHLTPIEFKLLAFLVRHAGKVVTHRQLLKEVWGSAREDQSHYPRIYVHQLRHKIEPDPARPRFLRTETGVGYRLEENEAS